MKTFVCRHRIDIRMVWTIQTKTHWMQWATSVWQPIRPDARRAQWWAVERAWPAACHGTFQNRQQHRSYPKRRKPLQCQPKRWHRHQHRSRVTLQRHRIMTSQQLKRPVNHHQRPKRQVRNSGWSENTIKSPTKYENNINKPNVIKYSASCDVRLSTLIPRDSNSHEYATKPCIVKLYAYWL